MGLQLRTTQWLKDEETLRRARTGANVASLRLIRHKIPQILEALGAWLEDVFNKDITDTIFRAESQRTLAPSSVKGKKKKKERDRLTLHLCCNITESKSPKPLMSILLKFVGMFSLLFHARLQEQGRSQTSWGWMQRQNPLNACNSLHFLDN